MSRVDLKIAGGKQLSRLGRELQRAGATQLQKELIKGMMSATKDVKAQITRSALENLPRSGGLNVWVAELGVVTTVRTTGRSVGVRVTGTKDKSKTTRHRKVQSARRRGVSVRKLPKGILFGKGIADLARLDKGRAKHPTYGHRPWVLQDVRPGFFTDPLKGPVAFQARLECLAVIERIEREIQRAIA